MAYQVNEIFTSIQGEGVMAGVPSTFIRLQGCPVGCHWCDSVRTWGPGHITNEYRRGYLSSTLIGLNPVSPEFVAKMEDGLDLGEVYNPDSYEFKRGFIAGVHDATAQWHTHGLGLHIPDNNVILRGRVIDILKEQSIAVGRINDAIIVDTIDVQTFQDYYQPMLHVKGFSKPRINGVRMEVEDIAKQVHASNVVITGGEPMLYNLDELIGRLRAGESKPNIQIETSGLCDYKGKMRADHMTISPKEKLGYKVPIDLLSTVAEIKFVVDDRFESHVVDELVAEVRGIGRTHVNFVLMPEGSPPSPANITKAMTIAHRMQIKYPTYRWRFGARLQYWLGVR